METRDESVHGISGDSKAESSSSRPEKTTRFRFKASPRSPPNNVDTEEDHTKRKRRRRHHQSSHSHIKRRKTVEETGGDDDDTTSRLPPDTAFRESLWDALGDDEGAAYWEGVYGQPIHTYPNSYQDEKSGKLEQMDDEEYAQFVRRKMWEKSWEGIEAAREEKRREREHKKKKTQEEKNKGCSPDMTSPFGYVFDLEIENSLKRGEQRKESRRWKILWEDYQRRWNDLQQLARNRNGSLAELGSLSLRNKIAWPVETGKRIDVKTEDIERFMIKGTQTGAHTEETETDLLTALKIERVRWHPDKMQQRYGFMELDEGTMAGVTAVFQVVDRMWNARRTKQ